MTMLTLAQQSAAGSIRAFASPGRQWMLLTTLVVISVLVGVSGCGNQRRTEDEPYARMQRESDSIRVLSLSIPADGLARAIAFQIRAQSSDDPDIQRLGLGTIAYAYYQVGAKDSARVYTTRALEAARAAHDRVGMIDALKTSALMLAATEQYDSALRVYDQALHLTDPGRDSILIASLRGNSANILSMRGEYRRSTRLYLEAIRSYEALGMERQLAIAYANVGIDFHTMGDDRRALEHLGRAIELFRKMNEPGHIAFCLSNSAVISISLNKLERAKAEINESNELAARTGDSALIAMNLENLGQIHFLLGEPVEAFRLLEAGRSIFVRLGSDLCAMQCLMTLAKGLHGLRRYDAAIARLNEALLIARDLKLDKETAEIHLELSRSHAALGNGMQAYRHLQIWEASRNRSQNEDALDAFDHARDEIELERRTMEYQRLQTARKHEADIARTRYVGGGVIIAALLLFLIIVLASRRARLRAMRQLEEQTRIADAQRSLAEEQTRIAGEQTRLAERTAARLAESKNFKELLLDVITHDILNPIAAIRSAVEVLEEHPGNPRMISILSRAGKQVTAVASNASVLNKIMIDEELPLEPVSLNDMISESVEHFQDQLGSAGMSCETHLDAELHVLANPVLIHVFHNYIANAIRYAAAGGRLVIEGRRNNQEITIRFSDFGSTIPAEQRTAIFSRLVQLHENRGRGSGLGLAIVARIMQLHSGSAWVEPNHPAGNTFCVRIPAAG